MVLIFNPSTWEAGNLCEFEASLAYTASSGTARTIQKPFLKNKNKISLDLVWRDGPAVKHIYCPCRRPRVQFLGATSHGSQELLIPSDLLGLLYCACGIHELR